MPSVRTAVWSCWRPGADGAGPQRSAVGVGGDGGFDGVLFLLAGHERPPAGPVGSGPADLDLGAVQPDGDSFGGGVGEHVGQGVQALSGRCGEAPVGQQGRSGGSRWTRCSGHAVEPAEGWE